MNILVISAVDPCHAAHNRLHDLLGQLSLRNSVDVISSRAWWLEDQKKPLYNNLYYEGAMQSILSRIQVAYLGPEGEHPAKQEMLAFSRFADISRALGRFDYDLIFNYNTIISGISKHILTLPTPMVLDLADDIASMVGDSPMMPKPLARTSTLLAKSAVRMTISMSDAVTMPTRSLSVTYGIPASRCHIIPNGVDPELFRKTNPSLAKEKFGVGNKMVIGFVGVLREWVDMDMLLESLRLVSQSVPNTHLLVVGAEGPITRFKMMASDLDVLDKVTFTGNIPYSEVPEAISAMDVAVIPFKMNEVTQNALPLKLFEYMACEIPVISQRLSPIVEAVGDNIMYAGCEEELAENTISIMRNPEVTKEATERCRQMVESDWSWDAICRRLETLMNSLVK